MNAKSQARIDAVVNAAKIMIDKDNWRFPTRKRKPKKRQGNKRRPVIAVSLEETKEFESIADCAESLKCGTGSVADYIKSQKKLMGYTIQYKYAKGGDK